MSIFSLKNNRIARKQDVTYQTANDSTHVEDHPEPRDVATLGSLRRVGHHDGSLGAPQQTSADTEQGTGKGGEAQVLRVVVGEIRGNIDRVADSTKGQSSADSKLVGEGAGEETNDRKGRVQGGVGAVVCSGIKLAAAAHAVEGIEHTRAQEADEGDNDELNWGRGIPGQLVAQDGEALVLP